MELQYRKPAGRIQLFFAMAGRMLFATRSLHFTPHLERWAVALVHWPIVCLLRAGDCACRVDCRCCTAYAWLCECRHSPGMRQPCHSPHAESAHIHTHAVDEAAAQRARPAVVVVRVCDKSFTAVDTLELQRLISPTVFRLGQLQKEVWHSSPFSQDERRRTKRCHTGL